MFSLDRVAVALLPPLILTGCSGSFSDEFEVNVTAKNYPFLAANEIALDVLVENTTNGTILVSNISPNDGHFIDHISWVSAVYRDDEGEHELVLERRTSEINRYRDIYNEGDYFTQLRELMPLGSGYSVVYELIAVGEKNLAIGPSGEIQFSFNGPIHNLGVPYDELPMTDSFFGPTLIIDGYRELDYQPVLFKSTWVQIPARR